MRVEVREWHSWHLLWHWESQASQWLEDLSCSYTKNSYLG